MRRIFRHKLVGVQLTLESEGREASIEIVEAFGTDQVSKVATLHAKDREEYYNLAGKTVQVTGSVYHKGASQVLELWFKQVQLGFNAGIRCFRETDRPDRGVMSLGSAWEEVKADAAAPGACST